MVFFRNQHLIICYFLPQLPNLVLEALDPVSEGTLFSLAELLDHEVA